MTHEELENYINDQPYIMRDTIFKEILDSDLLEKAFNTEAGKQILNSAVDIMTNSISKIIRACIDKQDIGNKINIIERESSQIDFADKMLREWAKILLRGSEHKDKIKKTKEKKDA
jgi:hypothetical protein